MGRVGYDLNFHRRRVLRERVICFLFMIPEVPRLKILAPRPEHGGFEVNSRFGAREKCYDQARFHRVALFKW